MSFDPYYEWLSIPPDEQPADYYRLIGVRRFETNRDVISNAAERQMLLLKSLQGGPYSHLTQKLMNEVARGRIGLLDERKKSQYDMELKRQIAERARESDISGAPLFPQLEELRPLTSAEPSPPRMRIVPAPPLVSATRAAGQAGHRINRKIIPLPILGVVVGVATPLLLWLIIRGVWQPATGSSDHPIVSHTSEQPPDSVRSGAPGPVSGAPVGRPPIPPETAPEHEEFTPVQSDTSADPTRIDASAGHRVLDEPANGASANVTAGDLVSQPPTPPASPEQPPNQSYTHELRQKTKAVRATGRQPPSDVTTEPAVPTTSGIFGQLPADVDVTTALSSDKQATIVLGTLPASAAENWRLALEDFAQPDHGSHLALTDRQELNGCLQWPLIRTRQSNTSPLADNALSQETAHWQRKDWPESTRVDDHLIN